MKKSVLTGIALISGTVLAVFWADSAGCVGTFCFGLGAEPGAQAVIREPAPPATVTTEELERIWKESEPAQPVYEAALPVQGETAVEQVPDQPEEPELAVSSQLSADLGPGATTDTAAAERTAKAAERWTVLALAALDEPDPELRGEAVHAVGLRRSDEAVAVLIEVVADDLEPDNRYQALEQLWYSAADGLDGDGAITRTLEAALGDADEDIAALAERALAGLAKLGQANN